MKHTHQFSFPLATLAAALMAIYSPGYAQTTDEVTELITPSSTISLGISSLDAGAPRFGQYTGVRSVGAMGNLDVDIVTRDEATGTWFKATGNNLGQDNRDMRISHERQGDWAYYLDYSQTPRYEPYTVKSSATGIGSANLGVAGSAALVEVPVQLKTTREMIGLGYSKQLGRGFDVQVKLRNEEKNGMRLFARGTTGGAGLFQFTPEPIHSATTQLETLVGYSGERLQLSAGYYGTAYDNRNTALLVSTMSAGAAGLAGFTPIGLPPDNQSHQFSLAGGYDFTKTTHGTFKVAYSQATQKDAFVAQALPGNTDFGGRVDTTLVQMGVTSRPIAKLSLLANLRYEDRDDKTPVLLYNNLAIATSTFDGANEPRSIKTTAGKLEASYQLPMQYRLTGGVDYEEKLRNTSRVRIVSYREKVQETSGRLELKHTMSDTVTGAVAVIQSDRRGTGFVNTVLNNGTAGSNLIAPINLADRTRNKTRVSLNWTPSDAWSFQFMADEARDDYDQRTAAAFGIREGEAKNYAIDASYAITDAWQATAWTSTADYRSKQATQTSTAQPWAANLTNVTNAYGLGLRGKVSSRMEFGGDISRSIIRDEYQQVALAGAAIASLPDISTQLSSIKLFGTYAVDKRSTLRIDYVYDRYESNDWTWSTFTYTDGTTVRQSPNQEVNFVGLSYHYKF